MFSISRKARCELCWIALFLCCVPVLYVLVFGDGGYLQLRQHRLKLRGVQTENNVLWQRHSQLQERVDNLENDPATLERIARERTGLARPGDIIVNLPPLSPAAESLPVDKD